MPSPLPTLVSASWSITALKDSLISKLAEDSRGTEIRMFFYAVTEPGWRAVRRAFKKWKGRLAQREIVAYVGTDHGITEADALRLMLDDGVSVRLMTSYRGVFHPKVVWLKSAPKSSVWIGSNNLTRDGLLNNIEFAAVLESRVMPPQLKKWATEVEKGSVFATGELLDEYDKERRSYGEKRVSLGTFTWSRREHGEAPERPKRQSARKSRARPPEVRPGDLIVEVMPRETGAGGKQIQLPMDAASQFFGMPAQVGSTCVVSLSPSWERDVRDLTMTIFSNSTVRLVIKELDYRDRPCVLQFRRSGPHQFTFDIVSRSIFPARYRGLLQLTNAPTRQGGRRWAIVS